jgi:hypothetical protein
VVEAGDAAGTVEVPKNIEDGYRKVAWKRVTAEDGNGADKDLPAAEKDARIARLPLADRRMAAVLVRRDAFNLARSLAPLTGVWVAHYVFGIGVVGMAVSSIIILMLINGFTVCEMLGRESRGWLYRAGCLMPCVGFLGPFFWKDAQFWLAVPTSMFGMVLLPVAYFAFYMLMNERAVLGEDMPRGVRRIGWNVLMLIAASFATLGSIWSLWTQLHWWGIAVFVGFLALAGIVQFVRMRRRRTT